MKAASRNQVVRFGDRLRILVNPRTDSNVYIVSADETIASLVYRSNDAVAAQLISFTSSGDTIQLDSANSVRRITIICSPEPLDRLDALVGKPTSSAVWQLMKDTLKKASRIQLTDNVVEKPVFLGGNIQPINAGEGRLAREESLRRYSGQGIVLKEDVFLVRAERN